MPARPSGPPSIAPSRRTARSAELGEDDRGRVVVRQRPGRGLAERARRGRRGGRGDEPVADEVGAAIDRAIDEIGLIADPHRAIDWLSTFPQVVLLALGEAREVPGRGPRRARRRLRRDPGRSARRPGGRAPGRRDARAARPRPGGDERRDDRSRRLADDVPDAVRCGRCRRRGRARARPRRSSRRRSPSPTAASRSAARSAARSSRS